MERVIIFLDVLGVLIPKVDATMLRGKSLVEITALIQPESVSVLNVFLKTTYSNQIDFEIYITDKFSQYYTTKELTKAFEKVGVHIKGKTLDSTEVHKNRRMLNKNVFDHKTCIIGENMAELVCNKCLILTAQQDTNIFKSYGRYAYTVDYNNGLNYNDYFDMYEFFENKTLENNNFKYN